MTTTNNENTTQKMSEADLALHKNIIDKVQILCGEGGVSGDEKAVANIIKDMLSEYTTEIEVDDFNNVIGYINSDKKDLPLLLLDAHLDEIGFVVTGIDDDGFLKVANVGGIDRRLLAAQEVTVHGKEKVFGIIGSKPPHLAKEVSKAALSVDQIFIDIGYSKEEAEKLISLGDNVTFNSNVRELLNGRISAKALDDRIGVVSLLLVLEMLKEKGFDTLNYRIAVLLSSKEEIGHSGSKVASFRVEPDLAIAVDVGFAFTSDSPEHKCGKMGDGGMIGIAPVLTRGLSNILKDVAIKNDIPYQWDVMSSRTSTNADDIVLTKGGVKTALISLPLKYMHTPIEMVSTIDVINTAKLIAEFAVYEV